MLLSTKYVDSQTILWMFNSYTDIQNSTEENKSKLLISGMDTKNLSTRQFSKVKNDSQSANSTHGICSGCHFGISSSQYKNPFCESTELTYHPYRFRVHTLPKTWMRFNPQYWPLSKSLLNQSPCAAGLMNTGHNYGRWKRRADQSFGRCRTSVRGNGISTRARREGVALEAAGGATRQESSLPFRVSRPPSPLPRSCSVQAKANVYENKRGYTIVSSKSMAKF
jgi:hypothetical protein